MEVIQRYIGGIIDTNCCNLSCDYCYLKLQGYQGKGCTFKYDIQHIKKAMTKERWGICYISLTGNGETLIDRRVVDLTRALLENGHYINILNNGTMTENFKYMRETFTREQAERTMISFSFHYHELKRRNIMDEFFDNIRAMKESGFTIFISLTLADEYLPILDEIKQKCFDEIGIIPQVGVARDERDRTTQRVFSSLPEDEYWKVGATFDSPFFSVQKRLYKENCAEEYCYAGELGVLLNFSTGIMKQCLYNEVYCDVFYDIEKPIPFKRVGYSCDAPWCSCCALQIFGMIPGKDFPYFSEVFNGDRRRFASEKMLGALSTKLADEYLKQAKNEETRHE